MARLVSEPGHHFTKANARQRCLRGAEVAMIVRDRVRLRIERIEMGDAARHPQQNDCIGGWLWLRNVGAGVCDQCGRKTQRADLEQIAPMNESIPRTW